MAQERSYWMYILASRIGGTLYIGVTNDLVRRIHEHKECLAQGFTKKYHVHRLVYFEQHGDIEAAIQREKQLKKWNRAWKIRLIEETNPKLERFVSGNCPPLTLRCHAREGGHPVSTERSNQTVNPVITGSSAFADDDSPSLLRSK